MEELEALTETTGKEASKAESAPGAADWLNHPHADEASTNTKLLRQWAEEPEVAPDDSL